MRIRREIVLLALLATTALLLASFAQAVLAEEPEQQENPWISTWDATNANVPRDIFNLGESVRIKAYNDPSKGAYSITLTYPDSSTTTIASGLTGYHEAVYSAATMTPSIGSYTLQAGSATAGYGTGLYTVIPELTFGTIATVAASFGALAIFSTKKRRL